MSIFITGASGFVGTSFLNNFKNEVICVSSRGNESNIDGAEVVIHLAGKAHDLKNTSASQEYYEVNTELTKKVYDAFLLLKRRYLLHSAQLKQLQTNLKEN